MAAPRVNVELRCTDPLAGVECPPAAARAAAARDTCDAAAAAVGPAANVTVQPLGREPCGGSWPPAGADAEALQWGRVEAGADGAVAALRPADALPADPEAVRILACLTGVRPPARAFRPRAGGAGPFRRRPIPYGGVMRLSGAGWTSPLGLAAAASVYAQAWLSFAGALWYALVAFVSLFYTPIAYVLGCARWAVCACACCFCFGFCRRRRRRRDGERADPDGRAGDDGVRPVPDRPEEGPITGRFRTIASVRVYDRVPAGGAPAHGSPMLEAARAALQPATYEARASTGREALWHALVAAGPSYGILSVGCRCAIAYFAMGATWTAWTTTAALPSTPFLLLLTLWGLHVFRSLPLGSGGALARAPIAVVVCAFPGPFAVVYAALTLYAASRELRAAADMSHD